MITLKQFGNSELKPELYYTYTVASATDRIIEIEDKDQDIWDMLSNVADKFFGLRMDNKVTFKFDSNGVKLYVTYWDGIVSIGTGIDIRSTHSEPYKAKEI